MRQQSGPLTVHVIAPTLTRPGGGERYALEVASALAHEGVRVVVHTSARAEHCYAGLQKDLTFHESGPAPLPPIPNRLREYADAIYLGLCAPLSARPVYHPHGWPAHLTAVIMRFRRSGRVVWQCNDYMFSGDAVPSISHSRFSRLKVALWRTIDRLALHLVDDIVVLSEYAQRQVLAGYGRSSAVIRPTFPYMLQNVGTEASEARPRADPLVEPIIVGLNILMPHRGVEDMLHALTSLDDRGVRARYVHIGSTDSPAYRSDLERLRAHLGLEDRVIFVGAISEGDRWAWLQRDIVFVFTPSHQTYSLAVLEFIGAGRPVVVASGSGIAEVISTVTPEAVYPAGSPTGLADTLLPLMADHTARVRLAQRQRTVFARYSPKSTIRAWRERIGA